MEPLDLHNYEAYLLDFFEKRLSPAQEAELRAFLIAHPELDMDLGDGELPVLNPVNEKFAGVDLLYRDEEALNAEKALLAIDGGPADNSGLSSRDLDLYKNTFMQAESIEFPAKDQLVKGTGQLHAHYPAVAYVEGCMDLSDRTEFEKRLKADKKLANDVQLLRATILQANTDIVFSDKASLRKGAKVILLFERKLVFRAAAAAILLFATYFSFQVLNRSGKQVQLASVKEVKRQAPRQSENHIEKKFVSQGSASQEKADGPSHLASAKQVQSAHHAVTENNFTVPGNAENTSPVEKQNESALVEQRKEADSVTISVAQALTPDTSDIIIGDYSILAQGLDDDLVQSGKNEHRGFWQKAAKLAGQANRFGVKSVDGVEEGKKGFRLSVYSFVVERH